LLNNYTKKYIKHKSKSLRLKDKKIKGVNMKNIFIKLKNKIVFIFKGIAMEIRQTIMMLKFLKKGIINPFVKEQAGDILKSIVLTIVLIAPGGSLILGALLKFFGKNIFPSAFQE